ncbi:hypothetical protein [Desulfolithobacter dissulfuricans]|uniref:hypothetical protein n=1 Tax=Desulfolithobacter dissulfuricans TaxID=2795293 RepID=UPI00227966FB|nr:hypothetical protein [Desulfolithobacter dissulfuricans]
MRAFAVVAVLTYLLLGSADTVLSLQILSGTFTNITSTAEGMISLRQQEHLQVTADGIRHLLVNTGSDCAPESLVLMSAPREATQWRVSFSLRDTDQASSGDILLENNRLHIVYRDLYGAIIYAETTYDNQAGTWAPVQTRVVTGGGERARAPTLAVDSNGRVYVAYTVVDFVVTIHMAYSDDPLDVWYDSGFSWGSENSLGAKSARMIVSGEKIGLIYTDVRFWLGRLQNMMKWSLLEGNDPATGSWSDTIISFGTTDDHDPFGSHFSAVTNGSGNVYLVWAVDRSIRYFRYNGTTGEWSSVPIFGNSFRTAYLQISRHVDGRLYTIFNVGSYLVVMESADDGKSFSFHSFCWHSIQWWQDWSNPRMETPSVFFDQLSILQQVGIQDPALPEVQVLFQYQMVP